MPAAPFLFKNLTSLLDLQVAGNLLIPFFTDTLSCKDAAHATLQAPSERTHSFPYPSKPARENNPNRRNSPSRAAALNTPTPIRADTLTKAH